MNYSAVTMVAVVILTALAVLDVLTTIEAWLGMGVVALFGIEMLLEEIEGSIND